MTAPTPAFMSLSFGEILILGLVAILVFGGRLPDVMRNLGRALGRFRQGLNDLSSPIRDELRRADVTPYPPAAKTEAVGLPPPATEPPPSPADPDARAPDAATAPRPPETEPTGPEAPAPEPSVAPRPSRRPSEGAADEPPPV